MRDVALMSLAVTAVVLSAIRTWVALKTYRLTRCEVKQDAHPVGQGLE